MSCSRSFGSASKAAIRGPVRRKLRRRCAVAQSSHAAQCTTAGFRSAIREAGMTSFIVLKWIDSLAAAQGPYAAPAIASRNSIARGFIQAGRSNHSGSSKTPRSLHARASWRRICSQCARGSQDAERQRPVGLHYIERFSGHGCRRCKTCNVCLRLSNMRLTS
jgi:hypothetical protein